MRKAVCASDGEPGHLGVGHVALGVDQQQLLDVLREQLLGSGAAVQGKETEGGGDGEGSRRRREEEEGEETRVEREEEQEEERGTRQDIAESNQATADQRHLACDYVLHDALRDGMKRREAREVLHGGGGGGADRRATGQCMGIMFLGSSIPGSTDSGYQRMPNEDDDKDEVEEGGGRKKTS